jgi:hypothetical protein
MMKRQKERIAPKAFMEQRWKAFLNCTSLKWGRKRKGKIQDLGNSKYFLGPFKGQVYQFHL